jgi:hypothetical protein
MRKKKIESYIYGCKEEIDKHCIFFDNEVPVYLGISQVRERGIKVEYTHKDFYLDNCTKCSYRQKKRCSGETIEQLNCLNGKKYDDTVYLICKTPNLAWEYYTKLPSEYYNRKECSFDRFRLLEVISDVEGKIELTPFNFANVYQTGRICFPTGCKPNNLPEAMMTFWTTIFNSDLIYGADKDMSNPMNILKSNPYKKGNTFKIEYPLSIDGNFDCVFLSNSNKVIQQLKEEDISYINNNPFVLAGVLITTKYKLIITRKNIYIKDGDLEGGAKLNYLCSRVDLKKTVESTREV